MNSLESYLRERYQATHWPYYPVIKTLYLTGGTKEQLNELREREMIKRVNGFNAPLIEIINWETIWLKIFAL